MGISRTAFPSLRLRLNFLLFFSFFSFFSFFPPLSFCCSLLFQSSFWRLDRSLVSFSSLLSPSLSPPSLHLFSHALSSLFQSGCAYLPTSKKIAVAGQFSTDSRHEGLLWRHNAEEEKGRKKKRTRGRQNGTGGQRLNPSENEEKRDLESPNKYVYMCIFSCRHMEEKEESSLPSA